MYLSRLKLDPLKHCTRHLRLSPYVLHQAVFRAFPDESDGGPGRVLYRVDTDRRGNTSLLVQSEKKPDWDKASMLQECFIEPAEWRPYAPRCRKGQDLYFRLRANPAVKKQAEGRKNGYRLGLLREEDQLKWFQRKAQEGGFTLLNCQIMPEGIVHGEEGRRDGKLRHYAVRFEGVLRVVDPNTFLVTIGNGIGPGKGFGFGLLSVAPLRQV
ncbi:MAG: type I-E CRISPR-associated protein Cas6/Cse3/CasE [Chloroflexota bacterium]|nr:type I-E CRISPR-associated protein Cas6/Cse3/CasE [Chloroflexota bacterium]